jgi:hypothetical protein
MPVKKMKTGIKDATNSMQETKFNARNLIVLQDQDTKTTIIKVYVSDLSFKQIKLI